VLDHVGERFAQAAVGFYLSLIKLFRDPRSQTLHHLTTMRAVIGETLRRCLLLCLGIMTVNFRESVEHPSARSWKCLLQLNELAAGVRQTLGYDPLKLTRPVCR